MRNIALCGTLLAAMALQQASANEYGIEPASYKRDAPALHSYCLETLCLGMTVNQVHALGRLIWETDRRPIGTVACTMTGAKNNNAVGSFISSDGTEFQLGFEPAGREGTASGRYRLTFIEAKLPDVLSTQVDEVFKKVLARYSPVHQLESGMYGTGTPDERFNVYIRKTAAAEQPPGRPALIMMMAEYRFKAPWLASLPECKLKVPRL
jgi:hypothetical protein